jgi:exopolysaccharide biosynthesis polyprenyl glycosylphosphotransferase
MFASERRRQKALYASVDAATLVFTFGIAWALERLAHTTQTHPSVNVLLIAAVGLAALWIRVFHAFDLYRFRNGGLNELFAIVKASSFAAALTLLLGYVAHVYVHRLVMTVGFLLGIVLVTIGRKLTRGFLHHLYADPRIAIPLIIAGFNPLARRLCEDIANDFTQYEVHGFLDDSATPGCSHYGYPVLGRIDELGSFAGRYTGLEVIVAMPEEPLERHQEIIRLCEAKGVRWYVVPHLFCLDRSLQFDSAAGVPLMRPASSNIQGLNFAAKRMFDLTVAPAIVLLALPLIPIVAVAISITNGRPILFRQKRVGIHGQPFELLKFRTMRNGDSDLVHRQYVKKWIGQNGCATQLNGQRIFKLVDDPRITRIGKVLRRLAIDELPQLINVLRGDMSLVGPRPALPYELELYKDWHKRRLDALPGITGLWQVNGRNRLGFDDMVKLDLQYLNGWSLTSDLKILFRTIPALLQGEGH